MAIGKYNPSPLERAAQAAGAKGKVFKPFEPMKIDFSIPRFGRANPVEEAKLNMAVEMFQLKYGVQVEVHTGIGDFVEFRLARESRTLRVTNSFLAGADVNRIYDELAQGLMREMPYKKETKEPVEDWVDEWTSRLGKQQ